MSIWRFGISVLVLWAVGQGRIIPIAKSNRIAEQLPEAPKTKTQYAPITTYDRLQAHPGYGLTAQKIWGVFRSAEAGHIQGQCDLFDDIVESDAHLRSLYTSRLDAIAGKKWIIQPGAKDSASIAAAEALQDDLQDEENFVEMLQHQLSAEFYGFAPTEINWDFFGKAKRWIPAWFDNVMHRRMMIHGGRDMRLITKLFTLEGEELEPGNWLVTRGYYHANMARSGLLRTATWWSHFKRMSMRDWVIFAAKFGIPHVHGIYEDRATDEAKDALYNAVRDIGDGGQAILHEATKIVIAETGQRSGDVESVHPAIVDKCDAAISKLISGATLNVETGSSGSYAQANVHENRSHIKDVAAAERISRAFRSHVATPYIKFNQFDGAKPPRLKIQVVQNLSPMERIRLASIFANELGGEIDDSQLREEIGFLKPTTEEGTLRGTKSGKGDDSDEDNSE